MKQLAPLLLGLTGLVFVLLVVMSLIQGERVRTSSIGLSVTFIVLAIVTFVRSRKKPGGPPAP